MTNVQVRDDRATRPDGLTIGAMTASLAFIMELALLPLILHAIKDDLALGLSDMAWVFNGYAIAVAIAVLLVGLAGDILNKRRLFMFGIALFAIGSLGSALSGNLTALVTSRIVQGLGGGLFFPLVPVLLTQAHAKNAGRILMLWGGFAGFAVAFLPILGAAPLATFGWHAIFAALAIVSSLAFICVASHHTDPQENTRANRPNYRHLFFVPGYWLVLIYIFLTYGCFSYYLFHFTINWHDHGFDDPMVSLLLFSVWITFSGVSFLLRDRIVGKGLNRSLLIAPALIGLGFVTASADHANAGFQTLSAILLGAGLACCNAPTTHLLLRMSPKNLRAFSASLDITFARCGSVAAVALLSSHETFGMVSLVLILSLVATCLAVVFLRQPVATD